MAAYAEKCIWMGNVCTFKKYQTTNQPKLPRINNGKNGWLCCSGKIRQKQDKSPATPPA
jgi:hypothetical protein